MAEAAPAVALLFDDEGLGEQLRNALQERGARIVHEGPLKGLSRELLSSVDADVLVVNLDDEDDSALDRLDEVLVGDRPHVVFNDAQASRRLEGWDRARWARHLAMKALAIGDADPPRPAAPADVASQNAAAVLVAEPALVEASAPTLEEAPEIDEEARQAAVSETLAAELEALLASDAPVEEADDFGTGLNYAAGDGAELHDGSFGADVHGADVPVEVEADDLGDMTVAPLPVDTADEQASPELSSVAAIAPDAAIGGSADSAVAPQARGDVQLDHLELAPIGEEAPPAVASAVAEAVTEVRISDSWTLLDDDAPAAPAPVERVTPEDFGVEKISALDYLAPDAEASVEASDPGEFGIEKISAADYLAPDVEDGASPVLPGLSLELVSIEEAIAPQSFAPAHEMVLDAPNSVLTRVVALGATTESTASVGEFLAALPAGLRATVLHTQHLAGRPADDLGEYFASQCALPVRLAEPGLRARMGEVIVVPSARQATLRRDGTVELQPIQAGAAHAPSIDASLTQAASTFGRDVIAIVFAGRSTDAVAGCQAVHDRGGQVWVEASGGAHASDMVSGVLAEHLSHHAGTPRELAARLAEYSLEGQP